MAECAAGGHLQGFFTLPAELRLEIYSHCPPFTLLQLSCSNHFFYHEINRSPKLYQSSPDYKCCSLVTAGSNCVRHGTPKISMSMITRISDWKERTLFNKLYPQKDWYYGPDEEIEGTRLSYARCLHCSKVGRFYLYSYGRCEPCEVSSNRFMDSLNMDFHEGIADRTDDASDI
ncbi:hypothetical protein BJ508DRAFT_417349 [Ascobolus immersus RN42]|uniref:F-box domain-containing protein n=1 Tax=Ascobolus immersus RN42 TaxID=1160509 RepID=A0A3N4HT82_ASCIM|nr:hypothetical protein BJ508DRAFT_417349 [Ascobolus immersus RN42]